MKINDKLYRFVALKGVFTYNISGIVQRENGNFYELTCENCSGVFHPKDSCKVLVAKNKTGTKKGFKFIEMLNNDDEYYWHSDDMFFYQNKKEAVKQYYQKAIRENEEKITELEAGIKNRKDNIIIYKNLITAIE